MMAKKANGLTVFITNQEATCAECGEGRGQIPPSPDTNSKTLPGAV